MQQTTAIIADDVKEMRKLLASTLSALNIKIIDEVDNGRDALNLIILNKPHLCFLDIDMPQMNGLEVLDEIRIQSIDVYPVIISGHSTADNVKNAITLGAKGFVVKPYTLNKVKQITEKYQRSQNNN